MPSVVEYIYDKSIKKMEKSGKFNVVLGVEGDKQVMTVSLKSNPDNKVVIISDVKSVNKWPLRKYVRLAQLPKIIPVLLKVAKVNNGYWNLWLDKGSITYQFIIGKSIYYHFAMMEGFGFDERGDLRIRNLVCCQLEKLMYSPRELKGKV